MQPHDNQCSLSKAGGHDGAEAEVVAGAAAEGMQESEQPQELLLRDLVSYDGCQQVIMTLLELLLRRFLFDLEVSIPALFLARLPSTCC